MNKLIDLTGKLREINSNKKKLSKIMYHHVALFLLYGFVNDCGNIVLVLGKIYDPANQLTVVVFEKLIFQSLAERMTS